MSERLDLVTEAVLAPDEERELVLSPEKPTRMRRVRLEAVPPATELPPYELELRHVRIHGTEQLSGPAPLGMLAGEVFPDFEFPIAHGEGAIVLVVGNPLPTTATFRLRIVP